MSRKLRFAASVLLGVGVLLFTPGIAAAHGGGSFGGGSTAAASAGAASSGGGFNGGGFSGGSFHSGGFNGGGFYGGERSLGSFESHGPSGMTSGNQVGQWWTGQLWPRRQLRRANGVIPSPGTIGGTVRVVGWAWLRP